MSYGSSGYGSAAIGGATSGVGQVFFALMVRSAGEYEAGAEITTTEEFYEVVIRQSSEAAADDPFMETRVYTSNDPGETPQQQVSIGDALYAQSIVGAARFVTVQVTVFNSQQFSITGRPYNQEQG